MPDDRLVAHTFPISDDGRIIIDDGRVTSSGGALVTSLEGGVTQIGMQAVQVLNTPDLSLDFVKSWQISISPQTTEILDIYIGGDLVGSTGKCYLSGGEYRCRTSAAEGSALHFEVVDRDNTLGLFGMVGASLTKLSGLTNFAGGAIGDVNVGEYAHGDISGASTEILAKGSDSFSVRFQDATFQDGENLTIKDSAGTATGVTCTMAQWVEGDFIRVQTTLKDEWLEGYDQRDLSPGGSKELPQGLYFRVKCYNAHASDLLRIKLSLTVGRL